jgi:hypothetical protein
MKNSQDGYEGEGLRRRNKHLLSPAGKTPIFIFLLSLNVFEKQRAICRSALSVVTLL